MAVWQEIQSVFSSVCDNPGGEDCIDEDAATTTNKRLQRMKVQSRKTFKFRKTRKREREVILFNYKINQM